MGQKNQEEIKLKNKNNKTFKICGTCMESDLEMKFHFPFVCVCSPSPEQFVHCEAVPDVVFKDFRGEIAEINEPFRVWDKAVNQ